MMEDRMPDHCEDSIDFIYKIPKTEIHLHLEGMITFDTLWSLYTQNKLNVKGVKSKWDLRKLYNVKNLDEFVSFYINVVQESIRTPEDLRLLVRDAGKYLTENNVTYAEIFFSPSKLILNGIAYPDVAGVLCEEATLLLETKGITMRFIADVSRSFGVENAMKNFKLFSGHPAQCVIGIGLGGTESLGPARAFHEVFQEAGKEGYHRVAHAGEDADSQSIWDSINYLAIERIGHGTSAIHDEKLMMFLIERQIPIEICVTSNIIINGYIKKVREHPIRLFFDRGINVTLNSDDPTLFNSSICQEYFLLKEGFGFSKTEIVRLIRNNLFSTFLPYKEKERKWQDTLKVVQACGIPWQDD